MAKEQYSAQDIRDYVESRRTKQGVSHVRNLVERCWMENEKAILEAYGGARKAIIDVLDGYGMKHLAQKMWIEWDREKDPAYLADEVVELSNPEDQVGMIKALIESKKLGRGEDEPKNLLLIARYTRFPEVQQYLARLMKQRRNQPNYANFQAEIDELLAQRQTLRRQRRENLEYGFIPQHDEDQEDLLVPLPLTREERWDRLDQEISKRYSDIMLQREGEKRAHDLRERRRQKRARQQGRPYIPRSFRPSDSLRAMLAELDGEDLEEDGLTEALDDGEFDCVQGNHSDYLDLEDVGVLPPETNAQYKARTWKYHLPESRSQLGDKQNGAKLKGRLRKENEGRRQEKSL